MIVRGKCNNDVPVLLKHSYDECIQLLLKHRQDAGIFEDNEFLFAVPTQLGNIRMVDASAAVAKLSELCAASSPKSLRGNKLRKHLASMCATMDLTDNDITNVAKFMGHSDPVHRNHYRHNPLQQEVVQMTALLQAAQGTTDSNNVIITSDRNSRKRKLTTTNSSTEGITSYQPKVGPNKDTRKKIQAQNTGTAKSTSQKPKISNNSCTSDQPRVGKRKSNQSEINTRAKRVKTAS